MEVTEGVGGAASGNRGGVDRSGGRSELRVAAGAGGADRLKSLAWAASRTASNLPLGICYAPREKVQSGSGKGAGSGDAVRRHGWGCPWSSCRPAG